MTLITGVTPNMFFVSIVITDSDLTKMFNQLLMKTESLLVKVN